MSWFDIFIMWKRQLMNGVTSIISLNRHQYYLFARTVPLYFQLFSCLCHVSLWRCCTMPTLFHCVFAAQSRFAMNGVITVALALPYKEFSFLVEIVLMWFMGLFDHDFAGLDGALHPFLTPRSSGALVFLSQIMRISEVVEENSVAVLFVHHSASDKNDKCSWRCSWTQ